MSWFVEKSANRWWVRSDQEGVAFYVTQGGKIGSYVRTKPSRHEPAFYRDCGKAIEQARVEFKQAGRTFRNVFGTRASPLRRELCTRIAEILNASRAAAGCAEKHAGCGLQKAEQAA